MTSWTTLARIFFSSNQRPMPQARPLRSPPAKFTSSMTRTERHLGTKRKTRASQSPSATFNLNLRISFFFYLPATCFGASLNWTSLTTMYPNSISLTKEADWCWTQPHGFHSAYPMTWMLEAWPTKSGQVHCPNGLAVGRQVETKPPFVWHAVLIPFTSSLLQKQCRDESSDLRHILDTCWHLAIFWVRQKPL